MSNHIKSETLLKLITENLPDLLWSKDLKGNYIYANDSTCKIFLNTLPEDAVGKNDLYFANDYQLKFTLKNFLEKIGE